MARRYTLEDWNEAVQEAISKAAFEKHEAGDCDTDCEYCEDEEGCEE